jgi:4-amino-4-deoxy-L-arabinose transferase-like glycosyltransferase
VLAAVLAGFVLRITWGLWAQRKLPEPLVGGDGYGYWYHANEIAHGRGYRAYYCPERPDPMPCRGPATAYYPIGYPALLAVVFFVDRLWLPGSQPQLVAGLNAMLGTLSIALVYHIGRKAFGPNVGAVAAWSLALFPSMIVGVATYSLETTFIAIALGLLALLVRHDWRSPLGTRQLVTFAVAFGLAVQLRPFIAPIVVGLAVAVWLGRLGWRQVLRHVGVVVVVTVVLLAPWTIRNAVRLDAFVPISTNLGDTMCMSRFPGSNGGFAWASHEWCADADLPEAERNPANIRAALEFIREHPGEEVRQWWRRLRLMMSTDGITMDDALSSNSVELPHRVRWGIDTASDVTFAVSWALALPGAVLWFRDWRRDGRHGPRRAIVSITGVGLLVIPVGLWGAERFHAPLIPFFCLFASTAAVAAADWARVRLADDGGGRLRSTAPSSPSPR